MTKRRTVGLVGCGLGLALLAAGCGEGVATQQRQLTRGGGGVTDGTQLAGAGGSKPGQPGQELPTLPGLRDLAVSGGYGYALVPDALVLLDLADPAAPARLAHAVVARTPVDLAVDGLHAYVACGDGGLQVVSVAKPREPKVVGAYAPNNGGVSLVAASGEVGLAAVPGVGVAVLDLADPSRPTELKLLPFDGEVRDLAIVGRRGYAVGEAVRIIDLEQPQQASVIATHEAKQAVYGLGFDAERAVLGDASGYRLMNLGSAENPITLAQAEQTEVAKILDAAAPATPEPAQSEAPKLPLEPRLAVADGRIYRSDGEAGLWVMGLDGGRKFAATAHLGDLGGVSCLAAAGPLVLVGDRDGNLAILRWTEQGALARVGGLKIEPVQSTAPPAAGPRVEPAMNGPQPLPEADRLDYQPAFEPGLGGLEPGLP